MDEDSFSRIPTGRFAISLKLFFQAMSVNVFLKPNQQIHSIHVIDYRQLVSSESVSSFEFLSGRGGPIGPNVVRMYVSGLCSNRCPPLPD